MNGAAEFNPSYARALRVRSLRYGTVLIAAALLLACGGDDPGAATAQSALTQVAGGSSPGDLRDAGVTRGGALGGALGGPSLTPIGPGAGDVGPTPPDVTPPDAQPPRDPAPGFRDGDAFEPPLVVGGALPGDSVLDHGVTDGVSWVRGVHESGYHWLDVGGRIEDYDPSLAPPPPALQVEERDSGWRVTWLRESEPMGTVELDAQEVVWRLAGNDRPLVRYGRDVRTVSVVNGVRTETPALEAGVETRVEEGAVIRHRHVNAEDVYLLREDGVAFEHRLSARPAGDIESYGVAEEVLVDRSHELWANGGPIARGETVETVHSVFVVPRGGQRSDAVVVFPEPRSWDATGVEAWGEQLTRVSANLTRYRITRHDADRYTVETLVDGAWLADPERAWPVTIDPTSRWVDAGAQENLENRWNEPFNQCSVRSRTQYWLSPSILSSMPAGSVITAASYYQTNSHRDLDNNLNRIIRNRAYVYARNVADRPPLTHLQGAWFNQNFGRPLWFGQTGKDGGTNTCFLVFTCRVMDPGWWGQFDSRVIRAPNTGYGDITYTGQWLQITAGHNDTRELSPWYSGGGNTQCSQYSGFQFSFCQNPAGSEACEIYRSVFEGGFSGGGGLPLQFEQPQAWHSFPRTRLWFAPPTDLNAAVNYTVTRGLAANRPAELTQYEGHTNPSTGSVHTHEFTVPPAGGMVQVQTSSTQTNDIRLWIYNGDGTRRCVTQGDLPCPPERTFTATEAVAGTADGPNDGTLYTDVCPPNQVVVGFRGHRTDGPGSFPFLFHYYTASLEPICAAVYVDRNAPGHIHIEQVDLLPRRGQYGRTNEYRCPDGQWVNGIQVRRRSNSNPGIHNFRFRCGVPSVAPTGTVTVNVANGSSIDTNNDWGRNAGDWRDPRMCTGNRALRGLRIRANNSRVHQVAPLCSTVGVTSAPSGTSPLPDRAQTGTVDFGWVDGGTVLRFKVDRPGRNANTTYTIRVIIATPPTLAPQVTAEPIDNQRIRWSWDEVDNDPEFYEHRLTIDGATDWFNTGLNRIRTRTGLSANRCYRGIARGGNEAGVGPEGSALMATLNATPTAATVLGVGRDVGTDGLFMNLSPAGIANYTAPPSQCEGEDNLSRYWVRASECNGSFGFVRETTPASGNGTVTWEASELGGPGCYDFQVRALNWFGQFRGADDASDNVRTYFTRLWTDPVQDIVGTPTSTSAIDWSWTTMRGAQGYFTGPTASSLPNFTAIPATSVTGLPMNVCSTLHVEAWAPGTAPNRSQGAFARAATLMRQALASDFVLAQITGTGLEVQLNTGALPGYGDNTENCGSRTAVEVQARSCASETWQARVGDPIMIAGNSALFLGLDEPGCHEVRLRYRNRSGHWNEWVEFRRWLGLDLDVSATLNRTDGVLVSWTTYPGLSYDVLRNGVPIAEGVGGPSFLDTETVGPVPAAPTGLTSSTAARSIFLEWLAPGSAPTLTPDTYTVIARDDGVSVATGQALGRRAEGPLTGYQVRIVGQTDWTDTGSLVRQWEHANVPGAILSIEGGTATQGVYSSHVLLDGPVTMDDSPAPIQFYQVRAVNAAGPGPPTTIHEAALGYNSAQDVLQWQRLEGASWIDVGAPGLTVQDFGAPSDGSPRWYRLRRTSPLTDSVAYTEERQGWRKAPPGEFTVFGSGVAGQPLAVRFDWTESAGAENYAIARDGVGGGAFTSTGINRDFTYTNLAPNTCFTATVRASNDAPPDRFSSGSMSTSFPREPRPQDLDFVNSADGTLDLRFSSSAVPGIGDSLECAGSENLSAILVQPFTCGPGDTAGTAIGGPTTITASIREYSFDFDGLDCVFIRALYRSRLGIETIWGDLGAFKGAPTGTPTVLVLQPVSFNRVGSEVQGSHYLEVEWSTVTGAEGYNFQIAPLGGPSLSSGAIKVPGGDAELTVRNLAENTCYEAQAQAFNVSGESPWGTTRAATSVRAPIFRNPETGVIFGDGRGLSCEPGEGVEVVNNATNEAFRIRLFDLPPGFMDDTACAGESNLTAMQYQVRRCELFDGLTPNLQTSGWLSATESPWIDTEGHHCFEIRTRFRNRDGVPGFWSGVAPNEWYRHIILDLRPPEDLVQVGAGYDSIEWGWSDASRGETRWDVRTAGASAPTMGNVVCSEFTRNRPLLAGEYTDSDYSCEEGGIFVASQAHGNVERQRRVRASLVDPANPNQNPWRYFGTMSQNSATGYTLVQPANICGGPPNQGQDCGIVTALGPESDVMMNELVCDRVDNAWVNCRWVGRMMAPNTRTNVAPGDPVCANVGTGSYTGRAGARLVRQRITFDTNGNAIPAGAEVTITENNCLDGSCPNGSWQSWIEQRGYGAFDNSMNVWPGCSEGRIEDTGLTYGAIYRYTLWYYNANGFINDATTWDLQIGCAFGSELGVCAEGLPDVVITPGGYTVLGECQFPDRGDGTERCDEIDWSCSGDPYTNPGDPPDDPTFSPGGSCGRCNGGTFVCVTDPDDPLFGDQICEDEDAGVNECDGCNVLVGSVGDPCDEPEGCGGQLACDPLINPELAPFSTRLVCFNPDPPLNACGIDCLPLANEPETPCGICDLGEWTCDVGGGVFCDGEDTGVNSCPSGLVCSEDEPGTLCPVPGALGVCADGVWECRETDMECVQVATPTPELCNGLDDDCNGLIDDGARVVDIELLEIYDGVNTPPQPCDIEGPGDVLCTGVRFRLTSSGTDVLPPETRVDVIQLMDDGTESYVVEAVELGREVLGGGSVNTFTLCWENENVLQDANLFVRLRDPEGDPICLDPDLSDSNTLQGTLGFCGPERCDGYDNNMDGIIDNWPEACGAVDLECVAIPSRLCTSDDDCAFGGRLGACNVHQGICYNCEATLLEGDPCSDGACPLGTYCAPTGVCAEGCLSDLDCGKDEVCYEGICIDGAWGPTPGAMDMDAEDAFFRGGDDVSGGPEADVDGPLGSSRGTVSERPVAGPAAPSSGCAAAGGSLPAGGVLAFLVAIALGWRRRSPYGTRRSL